MSADWIPDVIYPGGMSCDSRPGGMRYATRRKEGGLRGQERGSHVAIFGEDPTCLTPRKPVLHNLYQVPTFLGMLMIPVSENTKVKKMKKRRYRCTQKGQERKERKERKTGEKKTVGGYFEARLGHKWGKDPFKGKPIFRLLLDGTKDIKKNIKIA